MHKSIVSIFTLVMFVCAPARALPPIEAYGELPDIGQIALSPDASRVAILSYGGEAEALVIYSLDGGGNFALGVEKLNVRDVEFAGNEFVILRSSKTTKVRGLRQRFDYSAAFSINLKKQDYVELLVLTDDLYPLQSGLGRIVGKSLAEDKVFMPAFMGSLATDPPLNLLKVDLDTGRGRRFVRGRRDTIDWVVDPDGTVLAREDYSNSRNEYKLWTRRTGDWESVIELKSEFIPFSLVGVKQDKSALIIIDSTIRSNYNAMFELGFDGSYSNEIFARSDADVERVLADDNRVVYGVEYGGLRPDYEFFDETLTNDIRSIQDIFSDGSVYINGWSDGFEDILLFVTGGKSSGVYYLFDRSERKVQQIISARPDIEPAFVAPSDVIEYKARDGLTIPSIVSWPLGVAEAERKNLPLIVMPHGGPEAYDSIGFDWMAQYFASRGYMVLQPNFRGSDGFGRDFLLAGRGEWGGKMQDDVTDGVQALIRAGYADAGRVCIVGASYGGYSALIGGALTPELYKCIAAIAPVSDLPRMLSQERRDHGSAHWVVAYWQKLIGDRKADRDKLKYISPVNHAESFRAPVLLIHGRDDIIVPITQSVAMERALKRAEKDVTLVRLKGEDHYLSSSETRLETLRLLDGFVAEHLGAP